MDSYLKIYDGDNRDSLVLQEKTCGSTIIPPLVSTQHEMLIEFVSNQNPSQSKFKVTYKEVKFGDIFRRDLWFVGSPKYPNQYPDNEEAIYIIIAPSGKKVSLEFTMIELVYCKFTCSCICDYVMIIDGPSLNGRVLGKFCGFAVPPPIESTQNVVIIRFHSDSLKGAAGFNIRYHFGKENT
ncbi:Hypothetical predicted protein [Pelobates cultripes]|uniref:CUB domain-containing protein n=1 Tax=Pelobates cultripes TaxID=61616 RepID=A0AAD1VSD6_PELCU|nr:Hypothetical predicted protein [Pelobates cultripes]